MARADLLGSPRLPGISPQTQPPRRAIAAGLLRVVGAELEGWAAALAR